MRTSFSTRVSRTLARSRAATCAAILAFGTTNFACIAYASDLSPATVGSPTDRSQLAALTTAGAMARAAIERAKPNQQAALRYVAYVALAQHNTLAELPQDVASAARDAAIAHTTALVTAGILPEGAANDATGAAPTDAATRAATAVAERAAQAVLARAASDRFTLPWSGTVPPGKWMSQLEPARPPALPRLGEMKTFFLSRGDEIRPAAPPAVGSPAFQRDLDEIRLIAASRTPAQLAEARFWEMTTGSLVAGYWQQAALDLAEKHGATPLDAARAAAVALLATLDANIACHDAKYAYWMPRPSQVDPSIRPSIALPNHPSYPSNHACDSGAAALVLAHFYPPDRARLESLARAAGESRIIGAIHYRFDVDAGFAIARQVAERAIARGAGWLEAALHEPALAARSGQ